MASTNDDLKIAILENNGIPLILQAMDTDYPKPVKNRADSQQGTTGNHSNASNYSSYNNCWWNQPG
jgi:hypothetical protein